MIEAFSPFPVKFQETFWTKQSNQSPVPSSFVDIRRAMQAILESFNLK